MISIISSLGGYLRHRSFCSHAFIFALSVAMMVPFARAEAACTGYPAGVANTNAVVGLADVGGSGVFTIKANAVTTYGANGVAGMLVYDSATNKMSVCDGTNWQVLSTVNAIAAAGSNGQVQFNNGGALGADANFAWDNTNKRLGIGTASPGGMLTINGPWNDVPLLGASAGAPSNALFNIAHSLDGIVRWGLRLSTTQNAALNFDYRDSATGNPATAMTLTRSGNIGIGTTSPGARLHVNGGASTNPLTLNGTGSDANRALNFDVDGASYGKITIPQGGGGAMAFWTGAANAPSEKMRISATGKVGIGTSDPQTNLTIQGGAPIFQIGSTGTAATDQVSLSLATLTDGTLGLGNAAAKGWTVYGRGNAYTTTAQQNDLGFSYWDGSVWRTSMVMDSVSGNVGIGTMSPESFLQIDRTPGGAYGLIVGPRWNSGTSYNAGNQTIAVFSWGGSSGISLAEHNVGGYLIQNAGSDLTFKSAYDGSGGEKLRISSSGNVGIGTTNPTWKLSIAGSAAVDTGGIGGPVVVQAGTADGASLTSYNQRINTWNGLGFGSTCGTGAGCPDNTNAKLVMDLRTGNFVIAGEGYKPGGGSWAASSDARLKDIDGLYEHGLGAITRLNTVRFHYKKDNPRNEPSDKQFVGLIAQDVRTVIPEAVSEREDGYLDLDTTPINFALINAIKELKAANDNQTEELRGLRAEFEAYKAAHP